VTRTAATFVMLALALAGGCDTGDSEGDAPSPPAEQNATGDPLAEIDALRAAVERDPSDAKAAGRLAVALFELRETDEALELFERIVSENATPEALLNLGRAYVQLSRYPEAEEAYGRLLTFVPGHPVALNNLGNIAIRRGETEKAIELYLKAIESRPDYLLAYFQLGDALKEAGRYKDAYTTYNKVLELEPEDAQELDVYDDALYEMAALDITMGAHERAAQMLEELIRARPDHKSAYYAYGNALLQLGRTEEAQKAFARHLEIRSKIKPDSPMAMGD